MSEKSHNDMEQLKAAYALNMCTVSVSQIVDYNDEYILEQEYNAILNNLNLEQIPKDEALLNILVKLLNVITFFRIDKIRKDQIEKKYQRRVKNAIWSAVPNIGVIVAGNPLSIGLSLATQVGIGYINYRREKADALADKEDSEVELRITALEQFNALRRELFTTAWRLADEYQFPDRYRLTERQITQYNQILMDTDELRKYERLSAIQDKFEAYLPFWYFMGHSAKYISEDKDNGLEPAAREHFRNLAKSHFEKYEHLNTFNILREDELTASFALEYIDLLLLEKNPDKEKIARLISTAVSMSGNAFDILEICAVSYLKLGDTDSAERLLRNLVNENYNTETNSKLLSRIYVSEYLNGTNPLARVRYGILSTRVAQTWLFPMPENKEENLSLEDNKLQQQYLSEQKYCLQKEYLDAITLFIQKYAIRFNQVIPAPVDETSDEYFLSTEEATEKRLKDASEALSGEDGDEYRAMIRASGFRFRYVELINEMLDRLDGLTLFRDDEYKEFMVLGIQKNLAAISRDLKTIQEHLNNGREFSIEDYEKLLKDFTFQRITREFFDTLKTHLMDAIENIYSLNSLNELESDLMQFCTDQNISINENNNAVSIVVNNDTGENDYISQDILGRNEKDERSDRWILEKMLAEVKKSSDSIVEDDSKARFLVRGDQDFNLYFKNVKLSGGGFKSRTLAIIDDRTYTDSDLFITFDGVVPVKHNRIAGLRDFSSIEYQGRSLSLGWPEEYTNKSVNITNLYSLIENLGKIRAEAGTNA